MNPRLASLCAMVTASLLATAADFRVGMIGLDTSHVTEFTRMFNNETAKDHVAGAKVVAAFKGGSRDIESSWSRVEGYTRELTEKYGVKIYDSIDEMCRDVDVVMLESVDGRPHLEQAKPVFAARKPLFIDKPVAGSLRDAIEIYRLAKQTKVPVFSSSSLRYYPGLVELKNDTSIGELKGAFSTGPAHLEPHHPDFYWYGVHPTEALYTIMGPGCETVVRTATPDTDIITGVWKGGRVGTVRGIREASAPYRVTVFGTKKVLDQKDGGGYAPMLVEVVKFFQTGVSPVPLEETIEIFAFMEAADESKRQGGATVNVADVLKKNGW
ncbi:MAG TPA: Gfo/Idh/MocA family oxidoreductase [Verrucomicrobiae bacterium]|nr:Gfo/Idh/MocA family oxidoreductase [Verrucomicrobiae bacterium]